MGCRYPTKMGMFTGEDSGRGIRLYPVSISARGGSAGLRVGHELAKKGKDAGTVPAASFAVLIFDPDAPIVGHRVTTIDPRRAQRGPREAREAV
jgi:hypothetical protein